MSDDLQIKHTEYLGDDRYLDHTITLYSQASITPWTTNDFQWAGEYKSQKIIVQLPRQSSAEFAVITKPSELNITDQIIDEVKRVLRKLN